MQNKKIEYLSKKEEYLNNELKELEKTLENTNSPDAKAKVENKISSVQKELNDVKNYEMYLRNLDTIAQTEKDLEKEVDEEITKKLKKRSDDLKNENENRLKAIPISLNEDVAQHTSTKKRTARKESTKMNTKSKPRKGNSKKDNKIDSSLPRYRFEGESKEDYDLYLQGYYIKKYNLEAAVEALKKDKEEATKTQDIEKEEVKPIEQKPAEVKPVEQKPAEVKSVEEKPITKDENNVKYNDKVVQRADSITEELIQGLSFAPKDGKNYKASNIKVFNNFNKSIHTGSWIYNAVHFIPGLVAMPIQAISKAIGNIKLRAAARENIEELRTRLSNIPFDDPRWETLATGKLANGETRNNFAYYANAFRYPEIVNDLFKEKINEYNMWKVEKINRTIAEQYVTLANDYKYFIAIDERLALDENLTTKEREILNSERERLLSGKAEMIKELRNNQKLGEDLLAGTGVHATDENIKAANSRMSVVGKRFSNELGTHESTYQASIKGQREEEAIYMGRNEDALRAFYELEEIQAKNTTTKKSIFGRVANGEMNYKPLATTRDYNNDPFIRDLISSVATLTAAANIANEVANTIKNAKVIDAHNEQLATTNSANMEFQQTANNAGRTLENNSETFAKGMSEQAMHTNGAFAGFAERNALDTTDWQFTDQYRGLDDAAHVAYTDLYNVTTNKIKEISDNLASGTISSVDAVRKMAETSNYANNQLFDLCQNVKDMAQSYASTHPQFDLTAVTGTIDHIVSNPDVLNQMNNALAQAVQTGQELSSTQIMLAETLGHLPNEIATALLSTAGTVGLVNSITNSMKTAVTTSKIVDGEEEIADLFTNDESSKSDEYIAELLKKANLTITKPQQETKVKDPEHVENSEQINTDAAKHPYKYNAPQHINRNNDAPVNNQIKTDTSKAGDLTIAQIEELAALLQNDSENKLEEQSYTEKGRTR